MKTAQTDRIEKQIDIQAPVSRVWRALTDHREFGEWFRVRLESPFIENKVSRGRVIYPGYEHVIMEVTVDKIQPEHYFSFRWHPFAVDPGVDYSTETATLVEFQLTPTQTGTMLSVTESGFDKIPLHRRDEAFRMNTGGWVEQLQNIENHVNKAP